MRTSFVVLLLLGALACSDGESAPAPDAGGAEDGGQDAGVVRDPYPHACTYAHDTEADGIWDWIAVYDLDEDGRVLREELDADGDRTVNFVNINSYDDDGRLTKRALDEDGDGTIDAEFVTEYRSDGQIERSRDYDAAGEIVGRVDYVYDDNGFLIEMMGDLPGVHTHHGHGSLMTYENDENGCVIGTVLDAYHDEVIEEATEVEVDEDCNALEIATDQFGDGTIDWVRTSTYDDDGNMLTMRQVDHGNLVFERVTTWEDGRKIEEVDEHGTSRDVTTYHYDEAGNLLTIEDDAFDDGHAIAKTTYELDGRGNVLYELIDHRGVGHPDEMSAYTYDCWE